MYCTIQKPCTRSLSLDKVRLGALFQVRAIPALAHAVCVVSTLVDAPVGHLSAQELHAASTAFQAVTQFDRSLAIVVVGCTVREGEPGYVTPGLECDLPADTLVELVQQDVPLALSAVTSPLRIDVQKVQKVQKTVHVALEIPLAMLLGDRPSITSTL